jgi:hypothetical protein
MAIMIDRRDFLKLAGVGAVAVACGATGPSLAAASTDGDPFFFVQISDTHWGFSNPAVNPDFGGTLRKVVSTVNGLEKPPDFIVFTGDLTRVTDDDKERCQRLTGFREIAKT